ncbi:MAG: GNAT family N-acetyltransferase [Acidimicrobiales bacterium]
MTITIRPAHPSDADELRRIERLAGERFREVGLELVADDEPESAETLATYARAGRSWVAVGFDGEPVGYVLVDVVDGCAHVEQMTVRPDHQRAGVGRSLMDRVRDWATASQRRAVTLTTFAHVPWNRALYEHLGFRVLAPAELGPELIALRDAEAAHGLDPALRVCMGLDLGA